MAPICAGIYAELPDRWKLPFSSYLSGPNYRLKARRPPLPTESAQHEADVITIGPAERYTLEFDADADPGIYPAHCHNVHHVTTEGSYPGGMATAIVYESATETDEFAEVMDDAGYDG